MKGRKGFTLVELMIVMVIIGILLSLLLPGVFTARQEALKTKTASNMRQIGIALYAHAKNNDGSLPTNLADLVTNGYLEDNAVFENGKGDAFNYVATGDNLYTMNASDTLVIDDDADTGTDYTLKADGSVDTSG
jgi:prepilin-type N-terminal cleavage/methylation domain-containing protein